MVKIAVCDDDKEFRKLIVTYCNKYLFAKHTKYEILEYASGEELLKDDYPDILLLDIEMKKISGILVKEILEKMEAETRIIFVTNHLENMPEAFGRGVFGFLHKPIKYDNFCKSFSVVYEDVLNKSCYVFIGNALYNEKIYVKDIVYIEACDKYVKIYIRGRTEYKFSNRGLGEWGKELECLNFIRCHRSFIVNCAYIAGIKQDIELDCKKHIPVSRKLKREIKERYKQYVWESIR
ncbi:MAG: response regulator transcription factor [Lachnospiraceae bacterium]|nr:response regulator transcription factor [Lachnospiraceae bacterium]